MVNYINEIDEQNTYLVESIADKLQVQLSGASLPSTKEGIKVFTVRETSKTGEARGFLAKLSKAESKKVLTIEDKVGPDGIPKKTVLVHKPSPYFFATEVSAKELKDFWPDLVVEVEAETKARYT